MAEDVTRLLERWRCGEREALGELRVSLGGAEWDVKRDRTLAKAWLMRRQRDAR